MRAAILLLAVAAASAGAESPSLAASERVAAATAPRATGAARAAALDAAASGYQQVAWQRELPTGRSACVGYFDHGALRLIAETTTGTARLTNRYYYENGALFYFAGELPAATGTGTIAVAPRIPVRAEFRGTITLAAVRVEHYGEVKLGLAEISDIRRRAAALARAAIAERTAAARR